MHGNIGCFTAWRATVNDANDCLTALQPCRLTSMTLAFRGQRQGMKHVVGHNHKTSAFVTAGLGHSCGGGACPAEPCPARRHMQPALLSAGSGAEPSAMNSDLVGIDWAGQRAGGNRSVD